MTASPPVVVVVGASHGIGRATATALARRGASLVLAARDAHTLAEVAAACQRDGARAVAVPTDVADGDAVRASGRAGLERFGRLDAWVHAASVLVAGGLTDHEDADL